MSLEAQQISYAYHENQNNYVIQEISLSLERGEIVGLSGRSGCGKSTLLQLLKGLLCPQRGSILLDGKQISNQKESSRQQRTQSVGLAIQFPEKQLFERTVYDDIAFGPKNMKMPAEQIQQAVKDALQLVGLDYQSFHKRAPVSLSSGEKRRVALAGVLAMNPAYLLLDEPTAGLDWEGTQRVLEAILQAKQRGTGILLVSHHLTELIRITDRLLVMDEGKLILEGETFLIIEKMEHLHYFDQGITPLRELALQLQKHGFPIDARSRTPQQLAEKINRELERNYE